MDIQNLDLGFHYIGSVEDRLTYPNTGDVVSYLGSEFVCVNGEFVQLGVVDGKEEKELPVTCERCGAPLNHGVCEYCGTDYR